MRVIDAHCHLGPFRNFHIPHNDIDGLIDTLDSYQIEIAVVAPHAAISSDPVLGNRIAVEACAAYPDRIRAYYTVNPFYPTTDRQLQAAFDNPAFRGFKVHPELHDDYPLDGDGYESMWRFAAAHSLPILSHTYFGGDRLEVFDRLAGCFPTARILIGHLAYDLGLDSSFRLAARRDNVFLDLTGPLRWNGVLEKVVAAVGAERVVYGSDIPWLDPGLQLGSIVYSTLSDRDAEMVLGGTAAKLFQL